MANNPAMLFCFCCAFTIYAAVMDIYSAVMTFIFSIPPPDPGGGYFVATVITIYFTMTGYMTTKKISWIYYPFPQSKQSNNHHPE